MRMQTGIALFAGVLFTACCPKPPEAPVPAAGCPREAPPTTPAELEACRQGLVFDSTYEASDQQPLTVIDSVVGPSSRPCPGDRSGRLSCRYGPQARIEPAIGAQRYSDEALRQGRIIARLTIVDGEKEGYAKYGLLPGQVTYWWVQTNASGTGGTSVFITQGRDGRLQQVRRDLVREPYAERRDDPEYKGAKWWRAAARWIWDLEDETAKAKCGTGSCS
jgi:hypothetical protein